MGEGGDYMNKDQAEVLAEWIKAASSCVVFTGAGMSTESGLPDFRSQTGFRLVIVNRDTTPVDERADLLIQNEPIGSVLKRTEKYLNV